MIADLNPDDVEIAARALRQAWQHLGEEISRTYWENMPTLAAAASAALAAAGRLRDDQDVHRNGVEPFGIDWPAAPGYWIRVHPSGWPHDRIDVPEGWRVQWTPIRSS